MTHLLEFKAYLDYSLYQHLAGYQDVWFKYEVMAMKQIFNLPLKREGVEIMTYVADRLGPQAVAC